MSAEARGNRSEVLEFAEEPLNPVAHRIKAWAEDRHLLAMAEWADVGERALCGKARADCVAVIGTVGEQHAAGAKLADQVLGRPAVVGLPLGQLQRDRQPVAVDERVDLGCIPAAGTAHATAEPPFLFPLAACWWTRTDVLSIICTWPS